MQLRLLRSELTRRTAMWPDISKVNIFIRKHFVHVISVTALLGFLTPGLSQTVRAHKLFDDQLDASGFSLFLMMLSAAVQCSFSAFRGVVARPRALAACALQYFLILPASCWLLGQLC